MASQQDAREAAVEHQQQVAGERVEGPRAPSTSRGRCPRRRRASQEVARRVGAHASSDAVADATLWPGMSTRASGRRLSLARRLERHAGCRRAWPRGRGARPRRSRQWRSSLSTGRRPASATAPRAALPCVGVGVDADDERVVFTRSERTLPGGTSRWAVARHAALARGVGEGDHGRASEVERAVGNNISSRDAPSR